jgi:hypothetical protein
VVTLAALIVRGVIEACDWIFSVFFVWLVAILMLDVYWPSEPRPECGTPFMAALAAMSMLAIPALLVAIRTHRRRRRAPDGRPLRRVLTVKLGLLVLALVPAVSLGAGFWLRDMARQSMR